MGKPTIPTPIKPGPGSIVQPSQAASPAPPEIAAPYTIPAPRTTNRQATETALRSLLDANLLIERAKIVTPADIGRLQAELGIQNYPVEARIKFYFNAIEAHRSRYTGDIDNLYELLAFEFNALADEHAFPFLESLLRTGIDKVKKMKDVAEQSPVVGKNARWTGVLKLLLNYEKQGANLRSANASSSQTESPWLVHWNRAKFLVEKDRIIPAETQARLFKYDQHSSYGGYPNADPQPQAVGSDELKELVWEEFKSEGSCASINILDGAIFTWGRGFAGLGGGLLSLLAKMYADPDFQHLFQAVGIQVLQISIKKVKSDVLHIVTSDGAIQGKDALVWNYIKSNRALILFFIALGEMKVMPLQLSKAQDYYRQKNVDLQFAEICNKNPIFKVPDAQLALWKQDFAYNPALNNAGDSEVQKKNAAAKSSYECYVRFLAHLFHWLPVFGQDAVRSKENKQPKLFSLNILKDENGQYYKASIHNTLLQFADRAADDPINQAWTDIGGLAPNEQIKIFYNSLKKTRTLLDENGNTGPKEKQTNVAPLIMDGGHFPVFGLRRNKNASPLESGPVNAFIAQGLTNGKVIEFSTIELFDNAKPELGYQVNELKTGRVIKLNRMEFQGSAIYYKFSPPKKSGDHPTITGGYVIKAI